jgi:hypothetical protein
LQNVITPARPNLSDTESRELKELLTENGVIFDMKSDDLGRTDRLYHCIDTGEARPILQPPRRFLLAELADVGKMPEDVQQRGVIEESDSPWSSPVFSFGRRRDLHFCVHYRKLNDFMRNNCFSLPWTDDTLDTLDEAKWFSTLDLKSGYWQVDLHPGDKEKTAF